MLIFLNLEVPGIIENLLMSEFINLVAPELVLTGLPLLGGFLRAILRTG